MFTMRGTTITITQGDSGAFALDVDVIDPKTEAVAKLTQNDRGLFTVKSQSGDEVYRLPILPDEDGSIGVEMPPVVTAEWDVGKYKWDIRVILNAEFDDDGEITNGEEVFTPYEASTLNVIEAVGRI